MRRAVVALGAILGLAIFARAALLLVFHRTLSAVRGGLIDNPLLLAIRLALPPLTSAILGLAIFARAALLLVFHRTLSAVFGGLIDNPLLLAIRPAPSPLTGAINFFAVPALARDLSVDLYFVTTARYLF